MDKKTDCLGILKYSCNNNSCEKLIYKNNEYVYTGFEELCTYSGEVLSTREHKAITSKRKQNIFITIDELKVLKGFTKYNKLKVYNDLYNIIIIDKMIVISFEE